MNDFKHYRGRGRGGFQHNNNFRGAFNGVRRGNPNTFPHLLPLQHFRDNKHRWQRPQHVNMWRGGPPRMPHYMRPQMPPPFIHQRPPLDSRPVSPLPGSEEARQKVIAEASARIKEQLNLNERSENENNSAQVSQTSAPIFQLLSDDIFPEVRSSVTLNIENTKPPEKNLKKRFKKATESPSVEELRNKILTQFNYMSKGKIQSLVNNPGSSKYDGYLQHLVRDMRLHLSSELRNMYNNRETDSENNEMIDHFNSIVPDLGVELVSLPDTMVAELSKILQFDVNNDEISPLNQINPLNSLNETIGETSETINEPTETFSDNADNALVEPEDMFKQAEKLLLTTDFLNVNFDLNDLENEPENLENRFSPEAAENFVQNNPHVMRFDQLNNDPFMHRSPLCNDPPPNLNLNTQEDFTEDNFAEDNFSGNNFADDNFTGDNFTEDNFVPEITNYPESSDIITSDLTSFIPLPPETDIAAIDTVIDENLGVQEKAHEPLSSLNEIPLPDSNPSAIQTPISRDSSPFSKKILEANLPDNSNSEIVFDQRKSRSSSIPASNPLKSPSYSNSPHSLGARSETNNSSNDDKSAPKLFDFESVWVFKPKVENRTNVTSFLKDVISSDVDQISKPIIQHIQNKPADVEPKIIKPIITIQLKKKKLLSDKINTETEPERKKRISLDERIKIMMKMKETKKQEEPKTKAQTLLQKAQASAQKAQASAQKALTSKPILQVPAPKVQEVTPKDPISLQNIQEIQNNQEAQQVYRSKNQKKKERKKIILMQKRKEEEKIKIKVHVENFKASDLKKNHIMINSSINLSTSKQDLSKPVQPIPTIDVTNIKQEAIDFDDLTENTSQNSSKNLSIFAANVKQLNKSLPIQKLEGNENIFVDIKSILTQSTINNPVIMEIKQNLLKHTNEANTSASPKTTKNNPINCEPKINIATPVEADIAASPNFIEKTLKKSSTVILEKFTEKTRNNPFILDAKSDSSKVTNKANNFTEKVTTKNSALTSTKCTEKTTTKNNPPDVPNLTSEANKSNSPIFTEKIMVENNPVIMEAKSDLSVLNEANNFTKNTSTTNNPAIVEANLSKLNETNISASPNFTDKRTTKTNPVIVETKPKLSKLINEANKLTTNFTEITTKNNPVIAETKPNEANTTSPNFTEKATKKNDPIILEPKLKLSNLSNEANKSASIDITEKVTKNNPDCEKTIPSEANTSPSPNFTEKNTKNSNPIILEPKLKLSKLTSEENKLTSSNITVKNPTKNSPITVESIPNLSKFTNEVNKEDSNNFTEKTGQKNPVNLDTKPKLLKSVTENLIKSTNEANKSAPPKYVDKKASVNLEQNKKLPKPVILVRRNLMPTKAALKAIPPVDISIIGRNINVPTLNIENITTQTVTKEITNVEDKTCFDKVSRKNLLGVPLQQKAQINISENVKELLDNSASIKDGMEINENEEQTGEEDKKIDNIDKENTEINIKKSGLPEEIIENQDKIIGDTILSDFQEENSNFSQDIQDENTENTNILFEKIFDSIEHTVIHKEVQNINEKIISSKTENNTNIKNEAPGNIIEHSDITQNEKSYKKILHAKLQNNEVNSKIIVDKIEFDNSVNKSENKEDTFADNQNINEEVKLEHNINKMEQKTNILKSVVELNNEISTAKNTNVSTENTGNMSKSDTKDNLIENNNELKEMENTEKIIPTDLEGQSKLNKEVNKKYNKINDLKENTKSMEIGKNTERAESMEREKSNERIKCTEREKNNEVSKSAEKEKNYERTSNERTKSSERPKSNERKDKKPGRGNSRERVKDNKYDRERSSEKRSEKSVEREKSNERAKSYERAKSSESKDNIKDRGISAERTRSDRHQKSSSKDKHKNDKNDKSDKYKSKSKVDYKKYHKSSKKQDEKKTETSHTVNDANHSINSINSISESTQTEVIIIPGIISVDPPQNLEKSDIISRLMNIDLEIQNLMQEKWSLYKQLNLTSNISHTPSTSAINTAAAIENQGKKADNEDKNRPISVTPSEASTEYSKKLVIEESDEEHTVLQKRMPQRKRTMKKVHKNFKTKNEAIAHSKSKLKGTKTKSKTIIVEDDSDLEYKTKSKTIIRDADFDSKIKSKRTKDDDSDTGSKIKSNYFFKDDDSDTSSKTKCKITTKDDDSDIDPPKTLRKRKNSLTIQINAKSKKLEVDETELEINTPVKKRRKLDRKPEPKYSIRSRKSLNTDIKNNTTNIENSIVKLVNISETILQSDKSKYNEKSGQISNNETKKKSIEPEITPNEQEKEIEKEFIEAEKRTPKKRKKKSANTFITEDIFEEPNKKFFIKIKKPEKKIPKSIMPETDPEESENNSKYTENSLNETENNLFTESDDQENLKDTEKIEITSKAVENKPEVKIDEKIKNIRQKKRQKDDIKIIAEFENEKTENTSKTEEIQFVVDEKLRQKKQKQKDERKITIGHERETESTCKIENSKVDEKVKYIKQRKKLTDNIPGNIDENSMKMEKTNNNRKSPKMKNEVINNTVVQINEENINNNNENKTAEHEIENLKFPSDKSIKIKIVKSEIKTKEDSSEENVDKPSSLRRSRRTTTEENTSQSSDIIITPSPKKKKRKTDEESITSRSRSASKENEDGDEQKAIANRKKRKQVYSDSEASESDQIDEKTRTDKKINAKRKLSRDTESSEIVTHKQVPDLVKTCFVKLERLNLDKTFTKDLEISKTSYKDTSKEVEEIDIGEFDVTLDYTYEPKEALINKDLVRKICEEDEIQEDNLKEMDEVMTEEKTELNILVEEVKDLSETSEEVKDLTEENEDLTDEIEEVTGLTEESDDLKEHEKYSEEDTALQGARNLENVEKNGDGKFCLGHQKSILDIKILGDEFLAASEDGTIYKYCLKSGDLQDAYTGHKRAVTCMYVMSGKILDLESPIMYSGSLDCSLKCYNIDTAEILHSVVVEQAIQCMDSAWGYIFLGTYEGLLFIYNIKKKLLNDQSLTIANATVLMIKATQEGSRQVLILASRKREIMVRDAFTGLLLRTMCQQQKPTIYSLLLDRSMVYCGTSDKGIFILDFNNGTQTGLYNSGKGVVCMVMYKAMLFAGCYDGMIYVYNTKTQKHIITVPGPGEGMLLSLAISHGMIIAGTKKDHLLKIWKIPQEILNQMD